MSFDRELAASWERNAANWTRVVREGLIPSRRAGTDAAILDAIAERAPRRLLDIGCGEGWLPAPRPRERAARASVSTGQGN